MSRANKKAVRLIEFLETLVLTEGARAGDATCPNVVAEKVHKWPSSPDRATRHFSIARGNGKVYAW